MNGRYSIYSSVNIEFDEITYVVLVQTTRQEIYQYFRSTDQKDMFQAIPLLTAA